MTLELWLSIAGPVIAAGVGWWCRTIWTEARAAKAEAALLHLKYAALQLDCVERDGKIWAAHNEFRAVVAERYVAREEIHAIRQEIRDGFDRLEQKIDRKADRS